MSSVGESAEVKRGRSKNADWSTMFDTTYDDFTVSLRLLAYNANLWVSDAEKPTVEHLSYCAPSSIKKDISSSGWSNVIPTSIF